MPGEISEKPCYPIAIDKERKGHVGLFCIELTQVAIKANGQKKGSLRSERVSSKCKTITNRGLHRLTEVIVSIFPGLGRVFTSLNTSAQVKGSPAGCPPR
jgi:hypothetical protein